MPCLPRKPFELVSSNWITWSASSAIFACLLGPVSFPALAIADEATKVPATEHASETAVATDVWVTSLAIAPAKSETSAHSDPPAPAAENAPAENTPAEKAPAESAPAENTPAEKASADDTAAKAAAAAEKPPAASSKQYAALATGLLLRPADVVYWEGDDFGAAKPLMTHPVAVWCVDVRHDGGQVASSDYKGNLQIWDAASGMATMHPGVFERWTQAMRFAPHGPEIVAGNEAGKLFVWQDGQVARSLEVSKEAITDIAFRADGTQVAASDGGGTIWLFSWPALEAQGKLAVGEGPLWCVRYSADGTFLLAGSGDRHLYRVDAKEGATPTAVLEGSDWITRLAISKSGQVAAAEVNGNVYVLPTAQQAAGKLAPTTTANSGIWALQWADAAQLLVGTRKNGVQTLKQSWTLAPANASPPRSSAVTDDH